MKNDESQILYYFTLKPYILGRKKSDSLWIYLMYKNTDTLLEYTKVWKSK